jgi:hypothetical protein
MWSDPLIMDNELSNMNTMGVSYGKETKKVLKGDQNLCCS